MKKVIPFCILLAVGLSACRKGEMVTCQGPNFGWLLMGYDTSQLGVFIVNTYEKGTHFSHQLSHTVSGTWFHPDSVYGADTGGYQISFYAHPYPEYFGGGLNADLDYEFNFPLAGRVFWLRNITSISSKELYDHESGVMPRCAYQYYLNDSLYHWPVGEVSNKASMATYITFEL